VKNSWINFNNCTSPYCYLIHQPAPEEGEEKGDDAADDIGDAQPFLRNVRGFYPKCDGKYPRYCKQ